MIVFNRLKVITFHFLLPLFLRLIIIDQIVFILADLLDFLIIIINKLNSFEYCLIAIKKLLLVIIN